MAIAFNLLRKCQNRFSIASEHHLSGRVDIGVKDVFKIFQLFFQIGHRRIHGYHGAWIVPQTAGLVHALSPLVHDTKTIFV